MRPHHLLFLLATACIPASAQAPDPTEAKIIQAIDAETPASIALLEQLVNINSGTLNLPGVIAVKDIVEPRIKALGFQTTWHPMEQLDKRAGDLVATHPCPIGPGKCGKRILAIGHMDTVFELSSPFQKYSIVPNTNGNTATGPGVNDMKGGLVVLLMALEAMKTSGALDHTEITIVLSGDEESHGDPSQSRARTWSTPLTTPTSPSNSKPAASSKESTPPASPAAAPSSGTSKPPARPATPPASSTTPWAMARSTNSPEFSTPSALSSSNPVSPTTSA